MRRAATALVSGEWGFGQPAGIAAIDEALARVHEFGVSAVGVVRCNHLGRIGAYVERAAAAGCATAVWVGGFGRWRAVPYGGSRPALGTNPLAAGFPVRGEDPVVVDMATTAVAVGKIMVAHAAKKDLAPGSIVDKQGRPTTDPADFFQGGALLPFGAHKGSGLSILSALLNQVLVNVPAYADDNGQSAAFFLAVDSAIFRPRTDVERDADAVFQKIMAVPPAAGHTAVLIPGEPEVMSYARRLREGIPVAEDTWNAIRETAAKLGLDLPVRKPG